MTQSHMAREVAEIPEAARRFQSQSAGAVAKAAAAMRSADPDLIVTVARGSSDHAATYLKYAVELQAGVPVASVGPSVASIYGAKLALADSLCIAVSQSGKSPDIVEMTRGARQGGAYAVAVTNHPDSPLAQAANATLRIHAGPEISVAATKTFVTSAVAGLWLLAEMKGDAALLAAIRDLPAALERAVAADWSPVIAAVGNVGDGSIYTLGRGPGWAMSNEAALKFKETCQLHAESFSSAEVMHGPVSIVDRGFPVLAFAAADAAESAVAEIADAIAAKGASVFVTSDKAKTATVIEHVRTGHWLTDPIALIVSFYAMVERVAAKRGINPDLPRHLNKVTETL